MRDTSDPARILAAYYRIAGLNTFAASLVWGVNTLYLLDAGLDIAQVFLVGAIATAAIVVFEIPTGALADAFGRRLAMLLSAACLGVSSLVYAVAGRFDAALLLFCLGAAVLGLGTAFFSGAAEAWLVDALDRAGHREPIAASLARAQIVTGAAAVAGTVGGGFLAELGYPLPYCLRAALLAGLLGLVWRLVDEPERTPRAFAPADLLAGTQAIARASIELGWRRPAVRTLLFTGLIWYGIMVWAFNAWQPLLLGLWGREAPWLAGVVSALVTLATLAGNGLVDRLARRRGARGGGSGPLVLAFAVQGAATLTLGLAGSFAGALAALLLTSLASGVVGPLRQAALHREATAERRATLLSLDSLLGNTGAAGGQGGLGAWARDRQLASAYLLAGTLLGGAALILLRPPETRPREEDVLDVL